MTLSEKEPAQVVPESSAERLARIAFEQRSLEQGETDIRAGLYVDDGAVDAWLDDLVEGRSLTIPG